MIDPNNPPKIPIRNDTTITTPAELLAIYTGAGVPTHIIEQRLNISRSEIQVAGTEEQLLKFITRNERQQTELNKLRKVVLYDDPVHVYGPTGTGKELLAKALHGDRRGKFVAINCAGMPRELIESELFGHTRGSFTGAVSDKIGLLVAAANGTCFLDEIGELDIAVQAKLLRVLQERVVRPVGSNVEQPITCRIVSATNRDLRVAPSNVFREDLYWRLSMFELRTFALAERPEDMDALIQHYWPDNNKSEWPEHLTIDSSMLTGGCREIERIVRRYAILGERCTAIIDEQELKEKEDVV